MTEEDEDYNQAEMKKRKGKKGGEGNGKERKAKKGKRRPCENRNGIGSYCDNDR